MSGTMSGNPGTLRGTPNRNQARGNIPFGNSPGPANNSNIPRPVLDSQPSEVSSSVSASRQKQSKRDEVSSRPFPGRPLPKSFPCHALSC